MPLQHSKKEQHFIFKLACNQEIKHFKTEKQRLMWYKLHKKKCETCCCAPNSHSGNIETVYDVRSTTNTSYHIVQEVIRRPTDISGAIYGN